MNLRKLISRILKESLNELDVFHGSGSNFNKFNHKKHLSKGFGSQAFGWGSYFTDDESIANSYAQSAAKSEINDRNGNNNIGSIVSKYLTDWEEYKIWKLLTKNCRSNTFKNLIWSCQDKLKMLYSCLNYLNNPTKINLEKFLPLRQEFISFEDGEGNRRRLLSSTDKNGELQYYWSDLDNGYKYQPYVHPNMEEIERILPYYKRRIVIYQKILNLLVDLKSQGYDTQMSSYKYNVNIPNNNGENYIDWYSSPTPQLLGKTYDAIIQLNKTHGGLFKYKGTTPPPVQVSMIINGNVTKQQFIEEFENRSFEDFYERFIGKWFGKKGASMLLMYCGYDGIKYPAGTIWQKPQGAKEESFNYVLFDQNKAKITKKQDMEI